MLIFINILDYYHMTNELVSFGVSLPYLCRLGNALYLVLVGVFAWSEPDEPVHGIHFIGTAGTRCSRSIPFFACLEVLGYCDDEFSNCSLVENIACVVVTLVTIGTVVTVVLIHFLD